MVHCTTAKFQIFTIIKQFNINSDVNSDIAIYLNKVLPLNTVGSYVLQLIKLFTDNDSGPQWNPSGQVIL